MTIAEALKVDTQLKSQLNTISKDISFTGDAGEWLMNNHVIIFTDDERRGVITLGKSAASYKPGNICFNLKQAFFATAEYTASLSIPDSRIKAIQMLILTACWIVKSVRIEIQNPAADILCYMGEHDLWNMKIEEEALITDYLNWYGKRHGTVPVRLDVYTGLQMLAVCRCITIEEGIVCLCEKVWG